MALAKIPTEAEVAELVSRTGEIARGLAFERDQLRELVKAKDQYDEKLLNARIGKAIEWLWSAEAGPLKVCEARYIVRDRFGLDVDEFLRDRFGKVVAE